VSDRTSGSYHAVMDGLQLHKRGAPITSLEEWFRLAPPKRREKQWVDGRSAKELAKAFLSSGVPAVPHEIIETLETHPDLRGVRLQEGTPEHIIALDDFLGETRNADLVLTGKCASGIVALSIEAKADEPFGDRIGLYLRSISNPRSNVPARIESLRSAILPNLTRPDFEAVYYQLLHGAAASLIYADKVGANVSVFLIYEFIGPTCRQERVDRNHRALATLVSGLAGGPVDLKSGQVLGPFQVNGGGRIPVRIPLYIAKTRRSLSLGK
jgi:hypothetical protein